MLTDNQIQKLKPPIDKNVEKIGFANGLRLFVRANGTKTWYLDYRHEGNPTSWRIADYSIMERSEALRIRDESKQLRLKGIDPKAHFEGIEAAKDAKLQAAVTFETVINIRTQRVENPV